MQCSFTYSSTTYTYYVDVLSVAPVVTGRQERLISGDLDQDFNDIEYRISVSGIWEQVGASTKNVNDLWLDLLGGAEVTFKSDTDDSTSYIVMPDFGHSPAFVDVAKGTYKEAVELRLISKSVYQEDDSTSTGIADMRPHFGA